MLPAILPVQTFAAVCEACDWVSSPSPSNLTALRAFDRHAVSAGHLRRFEDVIPTCDICDEPEPEPDADWNGETGCHRSCEADPTRDAHWRRYRNGEGE